MRKFIVNVNGNRYEIEVEEVSAEEAKKAAPARPAANAPAPAPAPVPAAPVVSAPPAGGVKVEAPMPGNILDVKVKVGDRVKEGDIIVILEAMKMENEILAPCGGTIADVRVQKGSSVDSGALIAVIS
ncbi:MAG: acetyl-CoA carboxylase biotin carboxyl carrier protein subunit [Clostridia bacterium]|nr:acetyl-CoA carboxylase biotin carboxyl carrier protein subunit [Clostridia bacterium]